MTLDDRIAKVVQIGGGDFLGVADLSSALQEILEQGGVVVAGFPRAVSIGIVLLDAIVDQLPQRAERAVAIHYRHHVYDVINQRLDQIASRLGSLLQCAGHAALPIPASQIVNERRLYGAFSHKMAAHLTGMDW